MESSGITSLLDIYTEEELQNMDSETKNKLTDIDNEVGKACLLLAGVSEAIMEGESYKVNIPLKRKVDGIETNSLYSITIEKVS
jgi:hypothetical protein